LPTLSSERVARELVRLLETPDPIAVLQMMQQDGVLAVVLPEASRLDRLRRLIGIELETGALLRLAALIEVDADGAAAVARRLRFSNAWRDRLRGLSPPWPVDRRGDTKVQRRTLYRLGVERYREIVQLMAAQGELSPSRLAGLLEIARAWTPPLFPVTGRDVTALGVPPGERVGRLLAAVRDWWEDGGFNADRAACFAHLKALLGTSEKRQE